MSVFEDVQQEYNGDRSSTFKGGYYLIKLRTSGIKCVGRWHGFFPIKDKQSRGTVKEVIKPRIYNVPMNIPHRVLLIKVSLIALRSYERNKQRKNCVTIRFFFPRCNELITDNLIKF